MSELRNTECERCMILFPGDEGGRSDLSILNALSAPNQPSLAHPSPQKPKGVNSGRGAVGWISREGHTNARHGGEKDFIGARASFPARLLLLILRTTGCGRR